MVGVVVVGCAVLPGDGGHGSLPGDCLLLHVCCVSYLEHCIIQLDCKNKKFSYSHFGYSFTLYVLLYKVTVPARYIFDRENVHYIVRKRNPTTVRCSLVHYVLFKYGWVFIRLRLLKTAHDSALYRTVNVTCAWFYCDQSNLYNTVFCTVMEQCRLF